MKKKNKSKIEKDGLTMRNLVRHPMPRPAHSFRDKKNFYNRRDLKDS